VRNWFEYLSVEIRHSALYEKHDRAKWQVAGVIDKALEFSTRVGAMWKARNIHSATSRGARLCDDRRAMVVAPDHPMENLLSLGFG